MYLSWAQNETNLRVNLLLAIPPIINLVYTIRLLGEIVPKSDEEKYPSIKNIEDCVSALRVWNSWKDTFLKVLRLSSNSLAILTWSINPFISLIICIFDMALYHYVIGLSPAPRRLLSRNSVIQITLGRLTLSYIAVLSSTTIFTEGSYDRVVLLDLILFNAWASFMLSHRALCEDNRAYLRYVLFTIMCLFNIGILMFQLGIQKFITNPILFMIPANACSSLLSAVLTAALDVEIKENIGGGGLIKRKNS